MIFPDKKSLVNPVLKGYVIFKDNEGPCICSLTKLSHK